MRIVWHELKPGKPLVLKETLTFPKESYEQVFNLRNLKEVLATVKAENFGQFIQLTAHVVAKTELVCSYTLESVNQDVEGEEVRVFSDELEGEDVEPIPNGNEMELDDWMLQVVIAHVPMKVIKPGAKLPEFDGVEVLSEEEFLQREAEKEDPRFAKLKDWVDDEDDDKK